MPNGRPSRGLRFQNPLCGPSVEFAGFSRNMCAQYESVLHLFENNSGPDGVYRLRLQSAHKPPGPQLFIVSDA